MQTNVLSAGASYDLHFGCLPNLADSSLPGETG